MNEVRFARGAQLSRVMQQRELEGPLDDSKIVRRTIATHGRQQLFETRVRDVFERCMARCRHI